MGSIGNGVLLLANSMQIICPAQAMHPYDMMVANIYIIYASLAFWFLQERFGDFTRSRSIDLRKAGTVLVDFLYAQ
jgi:hypothetical protein